VFVWEESEKPQRAQKRPFSGRDSNLKPPEYEVEPLTIRQDGGEVYSSHFILETTKHFCVCWTTYLTMLFISFIRHLASINRKTVGVGWVEYVKE
jgi:hypothetical protein